MTGVDRCRDQRKVSREANEKSAESLKKKGMQINAVSPREIARMRERIKSVSEKVTKEGGEALANEMHAEIAKVRGRREIPDEAVAEVVTEQP